MKKPCKECPFKKDSAPGYLGELSYNPKEFLEQLDYPIGLMSCHMTVDWDNKNPEEPSPCARPCIGMLQFMNNSFMIHRVAEAAKIQKAMGKNEDVIQFKHNFIKHHSK